MPPAGSQEARTPAGALLDRYAGYLLVRRGLNPSTVRNYCNDARAFLADRELISGDLALATPIRAASSFEEALRWWDDLCGQRTGCCCRAGRGFPEPPGPGSTDPAEPPHRALSSPVGEPDPTEWPHPYERREDPRDPPDLDGLPFGEEPHAPTGSTSTSEPHPDQDIEAEPTDAPDRDRLDD